MRVAIYSHSYLEPENQKNIFALAKISNVRVVLPRSGPILIFQDYEFKTYRPDVGIFFPYRPLHLSESQYFLTTFTMGFLRFRPDIINVEYNPWSAMFLQAILTRLLFCRYAKLVCTIKKNTFPSKEGFWWRLKYLVARFSLRWTDHIIAGSEMVANLLREKFSVPSKKISVCHHLGVDIDLFKPNFETAGVCDGKSIVVGYCGRLDAAKGIEDLIGAMRIVRQHSLLPFTLKLMGCGAYSESLDTQLARESQNIDWLELLPPVPNADVALFLQGIDIFVLPSRVLADHEEHDAHALLEALAAGVACIGTKSGIIPEILGDGTGYLVNPEAPDELASALLKLISNEEERRILSSRGRKKAEREFSVSENAGMKVRIFKEVLNGNG